MRGFNLFDDDAIRFDGSQPLQEGIREHQPALARGIGHCTARCRELLARPPAKIAFIRFHVPLHETLRLSESRTAVYSELSTGRVRFGAGTNCHSAPPWQRTPRKVAVPPSDRVRTRRESSAPRGSRSPSVAR